MKWFKNLNSSIQPLILLGLLLGLISLYTIFSHYLKPAIVSSLYFPLEFCEDVSANAKQFLKFQDLAKENYKLRNSIKELTFQLSQLQEASLENQRLRQLLSLSALGPFRTQVALVLAKDSSNWTRTVLINGGSKNGIKEGMAVIVGANLAGRVIEVFAYVSKVALITDLNSKIAAKVVRTREDGVVFGATGGWCSICKMKYIQDVEIGDTVISSGLGGLYPQGLLVGEVVAVKEEENKLYKIAEIKPAVNFSTLEEVMVVTGQ